MAKTLPNLHPAPARSIDYSEAAKAASFLLERVLTAYGWALCDDTPGLLTPMPGFTIASCGLAAQKRGQADGLVVTGSAGCVGNELLARTRASYELIERLLLIESLEQGARVCRARSRRGEIEPERKTIGELFPRSPEPTAWQYARSNGVACQRTWATACQGAVFELIERQLVLESWFGQRKPQRINLLETATAFAQLTSQYEVVGVDFGAVRVQGWRNAVSVAGVFLFPHDPGKVPLAYGFGAGENLAQACDRAGNEAAQRLAFLWGEPLPQSPADLEVESTVHPLYHQEFYLVGAHQAILKSWLAGEFYKDKGDEHRAAPAMLRVSTFDLSSEHRVAGLLLARAYSPDAVPLVFGECPHFGYGALGPRQRVHPIV